MFLLVYLRGWYCRICWRFGWMVSGTAPSLYTAYSAYGWLGYNYKHRKSQRK